MLISQTFYNQLFHTKSVLSSFSLPTVWLCNFLAKEYWHKKLLVKFWWNWLQKNRFNEESFVRWGHIFGTLLTTFEVEWCQKMLRKPIIQYKLHYTYRENRGFRINLGERRDTINLGHFWSLLRCNYAKRCCWFNFTNCVSEIST